jgi:hypothetical protein
MSLFRPLTIIQPIGQLPAIFKRLTSICGNPTRHPLPVRRTFIGFSTSNNGASVSMYACPLCNSRVAFVCDYTTGQPRVLFTKQGNR